MRILVTDGDTRAALAVTRSLGRAGHAVHVSASRPCSLAGSSRYCAAEHRQAPLEDGPDALASSLVRAVHDVEPHLILGVTDPSISLLHRIRADLGGAEIAPPSRHPYERASDKACLFESCLDLGIPVPRGVVVDGGASPAAEELQALGSPLVVRPALSWRALGNRWIRGEVSYEDHETLLGRVDRDPALSFRYLVQEKIDGEGCGLFLLARDGEILEVFAHRRLREKPPTGGVSTLCESVAPLEETLDAARRFARAFGWSGLAMLEFKRDSETGNVFLLEVNARPWGSMALATAAGVDFPRDLLALATSGEGASTSSYRVGVRLRWWWGDVDHFYLRERAEGRSRLPALVRGFGRALRAGPWPEAWDTFRASDPLPFVSETWEWMRA